MGGSLTAYGLQCFAKDSRGDRSHSKTRRRADTAITLSAKNYNSFPTGNQSMTGRVYLEKSKLELKVGKALRSISSKRPMQRGEERILAILHHLRGIRDEWETKSVAETTANKAQNEIAEIENKIQEIQTNNTLEKVTFENAFRESKSHLIALGAVASLGIGVAINSSGNDQSAAPLFYLVGTGAGVVSILRSSNAMREANENVDKANKRISDLRHHLGDARKRYSNYSTQVRNSPSKIPSIALGSALIALETKSILNQNFLIDTTGLLKPSKLRSIALRDLSSDASKIFEMTKQLETIPVLLSPDEESLSESRISESTLHGEERDLKDAVGAYVTTLGTIGEEELRIHALLPSSILGQSMNEVLNDNKNLTKEITNNEHDMVIGKSSDELDNEIKMFEDLQRSSEAVSKVALRQLEQINNELKTLCKRYDAARRESTNELHANYYKILNRANWSSRKFYCPRTILSKSYLEALIGLEFDQAHMLDNEILRDSLYRDSIIGGRLTAQPQLLDDLLRSHGALNEITSSYQLQPDESGLVRAGAAADYIVDQYNQELALFRQRLVEAVTGSPNGFLGISESARLYYDPQQDIWSSPVLPHTYTTSEVERFGQVMKTDVELLIPLWEHLWTEKSDFRKTELFRTNESIQRMSEKEGEKIKQIGYQFQADLREVRSNIFLAKADFDSKLQELEEYEDGVKELGLMDENQLSRLQETTNQLEAISHETKGDTGGYEQILMLEPKNQLLRRQSRVHDPIDVIKSPDLLILGGQDKGIRRLLHAHVEEESA